MSGVPPSASRFDGLAANYARFRPSYPADAIATILAGLPRPVDVVDVGAGTGISTRLFVDTGANAIAIEPSGDMRAAARAGGIDARAATAYETGLADNSAHLVTAFQSFHWFCDDRAVLEFKRILRPNGRFAAVWNERDPNDDFARDLSAIDRRNGEQAMIDTFASPEDGVPGLLARNGFQNVRVLTFPNAHRLDEAAAIGRIGSLSFAPRSGPLLDAYIAQTRELFARRRDRDGYVTLKLTTYVFLGEYTA